TKTRKRHLTSPGICLPGPKQDGLLAPCAVERSAVVLAVVLLDQPQVFRAPSISQSHREMGGKPPNPRQGLVFPTESRITKTPQARGSVRSGHSFWASAHGL